jgi:RND family efflux transporter MFP subunit
MKKTIIFGTLLFSLFSCGTTENNETKQEEKATKNSATLPLVETSKATKKGFIHKISIQGSIESTQDILLNTEMSGIIDDVKVSAGDFVKAGQMLVTMDAALINANIQELISQLEFARYMRDKQASLFEQELGSEFDKKSAENQVASLESRLNTLNIQQSKMIVKAPFDGTIDQIFAKKGQLASPQMPLMRLVNTEQTEVVASVSEKHFNSIKKRTPLKVNFPNYNIPPIQTVVSSVGSFIEPTNRTFTIRAKVKSKTGLMPNMLTELEITDFKVDSGLVVPSKSILKNAKNEDYLWTLKPAKTGNYNVQQVFIKKLKVYQGEALIEDHEDITEGDLIIEGGARGITKKDLVRIK